MIDRSSLHRAVRPFVLLWLLVLPSFCHAAEEAPALVVGESGALLYPRQDDRSEPIAKLEKGETLTPLGHAAGAASWYFVKTAGGAAGWVKSSDVAASGQVENIFRDSSPNERSTWIAANRSGQTFRGTWSANPDRSTGRVSGTWTLRNDKGETLLTGTWSATKLPQGWRGMWRVLLDGKKDEYAGSWTASPRLGADLPLAELLKAAITDALGGSWTAGRQSGNWSIRTASE